MPTFTRFHYKAHMPVHALIFAAVYPDQARHATIDHIDGDHEKNNFWNLRSASPDENCRCMSWASLNIL